MVSLWHRFVSVLSVLLEHKYSSGIQNFSGHSKSFSSKLKVARWGSSFYSAFFHTCIEKFPISPMLPYNIESFCLSSINDFCHLLDLSPADGAGPVLLEDPLGARIAAVHVRQPAVHKCCVLWPVAAKTADADHRCRRQP